MFSKRGSLLSLNKVVGAVVSNEIEVGFRLTVNVIREVSPHVTDVAFHQGLSRVSNLQRVRMQKIEAIVGKFRAKPLQHNLYRAGNGVQISASLKFFKNKKFLSRQGTLL